MRPTYSFDVVLGGDLRPSMGLMAMSLILTIPAVISPWLILIGIASLAYSFIHLFRAIRTERDATVRLFEDHIEVDGERFSYDDITARRSRDAFKLLDYVTLHTPSGEIPLIAKSGIQNRIQHYRAVLPESEFERIIAFLEDRSEVTSDLATKLSVMLHPYG